MTVGLGPCAVATLSRAMHSRKGAEPTGHRRYICLHSIFASEVIRFSTVLVQSLTAVPREADFWDMLEVQPFL